MSNMADQVAARMRADGIDTSASVDDAMGGSSAEGAGSGQSGAEPVTTPPAGVSNTDGNGNTPDTIPYTRFQEVNSRYNALRQYEQLEQMGIAPDSAARLAAFERAYLENPTATIASMIDQQDLPEAQKTALKALLTAQSGSGSDGALGDDNEGDDQVAAALSPEDRELLDWARDRRSSEAKADVDRRIDLMVNHWQQRDEAEKVVGVTPRQRLLYISSAAGSGLQFQTLEEMADAARTTFLEDRDANLGGAVGTRGTGPGPLSTSSGGLPGTAPIVPKSMKEARALIQADMAAGRLPELTPQG